MDGLSQLDEVGRAFELLDCYIPLTNALGPAIISVGKQVRGLWFAKCIAQFF